MKPLDATLRTASAVAALALAGALSGCYYYAPYGYYPGYGYYSGYPAVPTAATQQDMPVGPGVPGGPGGPTSSAAQAAAQTQFTMPSGAAAAQPGYDDIPPAYAGPSVYAAAPAYYPVAYPVYPYGYP